MKLNYGMNMFLAVLSIGKEELLYERGEVKIFIITNIFFFDEF